jgi:hypothetical protein
MVTLAPMSHVTTYGSKSGKKLYTKYDANGDVNNMVGESLRQAIAESAIFQTIPSVLPGDDVLYEMLREFDRYERETNGRN